MHEERRGLKPGASLNAATNSLQKIDNLFIEHTQSVQNKLSFIDDKVKNDWCAGIMDGDSCFSVVILFDKTSNKISFAPKFSLTMETDARFTIEIFKTILNLKNAKVYETLGKKTGKVTSYTLSVSRSNDIQLILRFLEKTTTRNLMKQEQMTLMKSYFKFCDHGKIKSYKKICEFVKKCYKLSATIKSRRKLTLSEALTKWRASYEKKHQQPYIISFMMV